MQSSWIGERREERGEREKGLCFPFSSPNGSLALDRKSEGWWCGAGRCMALVGVDSAGFLGA